MTSSSAAELSSLELLSKLAIKEKCVMVKFEPLVKSGNDAGCVVWSARDRTYKQTYEVAHIAETNNHNNNNTRSVAHAGIPVPNWTITSNDSPQEAASFVLSLLSNQGGSNDGADAVSCTYFSACGNVIRSVSISTFQEIAQAIVHLE
jgi:hypothetical protein